MAEPALPLEIEQDRPEVVTLRMLARPKWEQYFLLRSDAHHDSRCCDQQLERKHLEEARRLRAGILDFGDHFDCMQGRFDKRLDEDHLPDDLRATRKTYLDSIVHYNAAFYAPYARHWCLLARGNHETAILNRLQTDLTERLAERLRAEQSPVKVGPFSGWIRFQFTSHQTVRQSYVLWWHHGAGGYAPVTKGVIQSNRQMVFLDGVDFIVTGHLHTCYHLVYRRQGLTSEGRPYLKDIEVVKIPGYKQEVSEGKGWAVEKGFGPEPNGAWWLRFYYLAGRIEYDLTRAR